MKAGVGHVARGSRRGHRQRTNPLGHSLRVLQVDILGSDPDIKQCSLDVRVSHQLHKRGQTDAGFYHVRGKRMSKPMGIGELDAGGLTMVAKQGTQPRRSQARSARRSFQRNEYCGAARIGPFQPEIVIEQLYGLRSQRRKAELVAFAANA